MAKGVVTEYLFSLIAKQVEDRQLVVWYDPERVYSETAATLNLPNTTLARYDGSFFKLQYTIDRLLNDQQPPRLVVYVPEDRAKTHHALMELEAAGVIMQPGQQPPNRNTRLAIVARNALRPILGDETAAEVEKQAESGKLSLADLNNLAGKGREISTGMLVLIFGNANPQNVALAFLSSDEYDAEVEKRSARKELLGLLQNAYDIELPASSTLLSDARERLARHVLLTDLVAGLEDAAPASLASAKVASMPSAVDFCVGLARTWRLRRDVRDSYVTVANRVEQAFSLGKLKLDQDPNRMLEVETFLAVERALLQYVENALLEVVDEELLELAESRLSRFWADTLPSIQAHWALIASVAEVLLEAERVAKALKKPPSTVPALVQSYAEGDKPWCLLDTYHRHMESRWYNFEPESEDKPPQL